MGLFGLWGKYQQTLDITGDRLALYTQSVGSVVQGMAFNGYGNNSLLTAEWTDENNTNLYPGATYSNTISKVGNFIGATVAASLTSLVSRKDGRARMGYTFSASGVSGPVDSNFLNAQSLHWAFANLGSGATVTSPVIQKYIFHTPDLISEMHIGGNLSSDPAFLSSGDLFDGINYGTKYFKLPYLVNAKNLVISLSAASYTTMYPGIRSQKILGAWPPNLQNLEISPTTTNTSNDLTSIENKFPATLQNLKMYLSSSSSNLAGDTDRLIQDCSNLKNLMLGRESFFPSYSPDTANRFNVGPTLTLTHVNSLESILIDSASIVKIDYGYTSSNSNLQRVVLYNCTAIGATSWFGMHQAFMTSPVAVTGIFSDCGVSCSAPITDNYVSGNVYTVQVDTNRITGDVTLTTSRPELKTFYLGDPITSVSDNSKSIRTNVNISGLTRATTLSLTNSLIQDLILPAGATACTALYLGGNKLDVTVNTSLVSQINQMSSLNALYFSTVYSTSSNIGSSASIYGQNSNNGFGSNLDLSTNTSLTTFIGTNSAMSGVLALPSSVSFVSIAYNNLTGISGSGNFYNLSSFHAHNNPSFGFDFTRLKAVRSTIVSSTGITAMDLSGRTSTDTWSAYYVIYAANCSSLTTVTFPGASSSMKIYDTRSNNDIDTEINFSGCSNLSSMSNMENINYSGKDDSSRGLNTRIFNASSCSLNQDLKLGYNDFVPNRIYLSNNAMSQSNVDTNIDNVYQNRSKWQITGFYDWYNPYVYLGISGTNSTPTGTYQAPTGYKKIMINNISKAQPCVVTYSATQSVGSLANDDIVLMRLVTGMTQVSGNIYTVKSVSTGATQGTCELWVSDGSTSVNSTSYSTFTGTAGNIAFMGVTGSPASAKEKAYVLENLYSWDIDFKP